MAKKDLLGAFEELVLLALVHAAEESYGMTIRREIEMRTDREVTIGAVYATLDRLEDKGYVTSRTASPGVERRGRARRYFSLTRNGARILEEARDLSARMWQGVQLERAWR